MTHHPTRPAECKPGSMQDQTNELGQRVRLSRDRLMASELRRNTRAWRLWAACVEATASYTREADMSYATTLGKAAGIERQVACQLLLQFDALGVFQWKAAERGSREWRRLALPALPSRGQSGTAKRPAKTSRGQSGTANAPLHGAKVAPLHSNVVEGNGASGPRAGTHAGWEAERHAPENEAPDLSALSREELARLAWAQPDLVPAIRAELERRQAAGPAMPEVTDPGVRRLFGLDNPDAWHADERTGDGVGDEEAAQVRHAGANPRKARRRESDE